MTKLKLWLFISFMPFMSGIIVAANLDALVSKQNMEGHWWKVILSLFLGFVVWPIWASSYMKQAVYEKEKEMNAKASCCGSDID
jgi:hypothetical protein